VTILVSAATRAHREEDMRGLVWALTERQSDAGLPWHQKPATLGLIILALVAALNVLFW
jgi:hypothetical protein